MRTKALGLDAEVRIRKRGTLYEVASWWLFNGGAPPLIRYYKRSSWIVKLLYWGFPWAVATDESETRAYIEAPFSLQALIWLVAAAAVEREERARELLEFVLWEGAPTAALDLLFESLTLSPDCSQMTVNPQKAARLMRNVLELGAMVSREVARMRREGTSPPKPDYGRPVEILIRGNRVEARGFGVEAPLYAYEAEDGRAMADVMCAYFDCSRGNGSAAAAAEGAAAKYLLVWSLASMALKPREYRSYMNVLALYGIPDSAVHAIGYALRGAGELLLFKRYVAELVRELAYYNAEVRAARSEGCKGRNARILDYV